MIPDSWSAHRFADIATYKAGHTPPRANSAYWQDGADNLPWLAISDMTSFGIVTKTKKTITRTAFDEVFRGRFVPAGTLLMSFKLTIGRIATLGINACHNEAIISIYPKPGIDQRYLGYFLAQVDYDALQDRQVKGNTLNREKIDRIKVLVPPLEEQSSIADILDLLRRNIEIQQKSLVTTQDLFKTILNELMTGKIHTADLNIQL